MTKAGPFLSPMEVADDLGLSRTTVYEWCKAGKLPTIRIGRNFRIPLEPYLAFKATVTRVEVVATPELLTLVDGWLQHLRAGARPLSPRTIEGYRHYFIRYIRLLGGVSTVSEAVAKGQVARALEHIPVASYSNRNGTYFAVVSFAKYLAMRGLVPDSAAAELRPLRPRRYYPAHKTVLDREQVDRLVAAIWLGKGNSPYERQLNFAIIKTFLLSGLRNQELCDLRLDDVDLVQRILRVRLGKGAKPRQLGITLELANVLSDYLEKRPSAGPSAYFVTEAGTPLTPRLVSRRVQRLAKAAGVDVTPHGLRRTWVTLAALNGRPLAVISQACGHANLATTQGYLMLSERQVLDEMRQW